MQQIRCERYHCTLSIRACILRQQDRYLRAGCQACEQGARIMQETITCKKCGMDKPKEDFYANPHNVRNGGVDTICKECRLKAQRDKTLRRKIEQQVQSSAPESPQTPPAPEQESAVVPARLSGWCITLDFSDFPDVLEQLGQQARQEIRSTEGQALYILRQTFNASAIRKALAAELN